MTKDFAIKLACAYYNYKWPPRMTSGVMFYEGYKITIQEFNEFARNFK
jgi:hypothetical protein